LADDVPVNSNKFRKSLSNDFYQKKIKHLLIFCTFVLYYCLRIRESYESSLVKEDSVYRDENGKLCDSEACEQASYDHHEDGNAVVFVAD